DVDHEGEHIGQGHHGAAGSHSGAHLPAPPRTPCHPDADRRQLREQVSATESGKDPGAGDPLHPADNVLRPPPGQHDAADDRHRARHATQMPIAGSSVNRNPQPSPARIPVLETPCTQPTTICAHHRGSTMLPTIASAMSTATMPRMMVALRSHVGETPSVYRQ